MLERPFFRDISRQADAGVSALGKGLYSMVDPAGIAWIAYLDGNGVPRPHSHLMRALDVALAAMRADGTLAALDWFGYFGFGAAATTLPDVVQPGVITWTQTDGEMLQPLCGFKGTGVANTGPYLLCNKAPSELTKYTQNAASAFVYAEQGTTTGITLATTDGGSVSGLGISMSGSTGNQNTRVQNTAIVAVAGQSENGIAGGVRESATRLVAYRNGSPIGSSDASTSVSLSASKITLLRSGTAREDDLIRGTFGGGMLTAGRVLTATNALLSLKAASVQLGGT